MKYLVTFVSSGGLTVEANSPREARDIFNKEMQHEAAEEMRLNGIDITEISEFEE